MQEQVHHQENQRDSFQQRFDHIDNRGFDKGGGFIRDLVFQAVREVLRQLVEAIQYQLRGRHFVRAGGQLNAKTGSRIAVKTAEVVIFFRPQLHGGDIAQFDLGTVLINAQGDIAKLLRRLQQRLRINGGVQRLLVDRRRTAKLPDGDLRILRLNCIGHVFRGHLKTIQFGRIEPDTHRVL